jgi:predicted exporter
MPNKLFPFRPPHLSGQKQALAFWVLPHAALIVALLVSLPFAEPLSINTNLLDLLPVVPRARGAGVSISAADNAVTGNMSRSVILLAKAEDFERAKAAAAALYEKLASSRYFESITFYVDTAVMSQFSDFLYDYRYALLDTETRSLLEQGNAGLVAQDALARVYSAFTFSSLENLEHDPFLLTERELKRFLASTLLSAGSVSVREEVLCAEHEGAWFVMIRAGLTKAGASFSKKENGVRFIGAAAAACEEQGVRIYVSGVPFHTFESSSSAQKEISIISTVSLALIIALFWWAFRSFAPMCFAALSIVLSIGAALGGAFLFFRELHIITLVFGTALIGIGIDYSLHFFTHVYLGGNNGAETRKRIQRGITMGFVSTELCFILLLFAPFTILKQFSVFSLFGMASSYLSVMYVFPLVVKKPPAGGSTCVSLAGRFQALRVPHPRVNALLLVLMVCAALIIISTGGRFKRLSIQNDIRALYTMSPAMLENERTVSSVLNYGSAPWYYLVAGVSAQSVLETEEQLCALLEQEVAAKRLRSFMATSVFIPSVAVQARNYAASSALPPLAEAQFSALGFSPDAVASFIADFNAKGSHFLSPVSAVPSYLKDIISTLWLGELDGYYYSCVLPLHADADISRFAAIAESVDSVYLVNKIGSVSDALNSLTKTMLWLYLLSYALIALVVKRCYPWRQTLKICLSPLIVILVTMAVLLLTAIPFGFFLGAAFVLVFGLGLDYQFYVIESGKHQHEERDFLAIAFSFITTALSFGTLALSAFVPVHVFGLVVLVGLSAAFVSALLLRGERHA